jgi:hypothetical protein
MKSQIALAWNAVMDHRFNPLRHMELAQRHYLMQVLAWMWSMIFSVSFLSIYVFGYVWLSHVLLIAGLFVTITIFRRAETQSRKPRPAPYLSGASHCVWQMDREA